MHLGLAESIVLTLVDERPVHGFALAALTARDGELGRIWHMQRPVVYRALNRLRESDLIRQAAVESDGGPQRTVYAVTPQGRRQAQEWLQTPVRHVREMRSQFLIKLALLHRRYADTVPLLARQHEVLTGIVGALQQEETPQYADFDAVLLSWRRANAGAALAFVEELSRSGRPAAPQRR